MHPWKFSNVSVSLTPCDSAWISSVVSKRHPFNRNFILGNRKKSQGGGGGVRRLEGGNHCNVFGSRELSNNNGRVVIVEKPIAVLPFVWTSAPSALPQPLQDVTVKLAIDGLTRRYEFLVDSASDVEETVNMDWTLLRT